MHYLSEGLEGRSNNPVALLFDALFHPDADIGKEQPSALKWIGPTDGRSKCSHLVIGEEKPGGQWHVMDKSILTLSLSNWLELPIFSFKEWKKEKGRSLIDEKMPDFYPPRGYADMRAMAGDVAEYYVRYVERMDLKDNFMNGLTVEKVEMKRKCPLASKMGTPELSTTVTDQKCKYKCKNEKPFPEDKGVVCPTFEECNRWVVKSKRSRLGDDKAEVSENVHIQAKNLILAGGLGSPMKLGVPGEDRDYVITLQAFQQNLQKIKQNGGRVLVVGAGMSGSDLALLCIKENIPCYHVFKQKPNDPGLMVAGMQAGLYEEYYYLSTLMKGTKTSPFYTPFSQHVVKEFNDNNSCVLMNLKNGDTVTLKVSRAVAMIGYAANLDYLPEEVKLHLLSDLSQPVHNKKNPLDVDLYSFQSEVFPNLYALGPLTGDNFVRFVLGSGLGSAQNILHRKCPK